MQQNSQGQHRLQERVERTWRNSEPRTGLLNKIGSGDVKAAEQVVELMVHDIERIDRQNTVEDVTDAEFHRWANGPGHNQLDLEWSLRQFYYFMKA